MGKPLVSKFEKRFGKRISVAYSDRSLTPDEQKLRNEAIARAITQVIKGILNREPTDEELLGIVPLEIKKRRR